VLEWQKKTKATARAKGYTRSLMGRYRMLPEARGNDRKLIGHAERASINTPIQGGAADVAMMAMIKINQDPRLRELGWILLLQVHDEVMLEGPTETAEEAYKIVTDIMQNPFDVGLPKTAVELLVDGSFASTWYEAK
jgi:DNA polymerase-1